MSIGIKFYNLWLFYVLAYAVAFPLRTYANARRGEPIEDPQFLSEHKMVMAVTMIWLFGGLFLSLFVPLNSGLLLYLGLAFYIPGVIIAALALYTLSYKSGLVTVGVYRFSRNPNYVGWTLVIFGLCLMGWSASIWSLLFALYFILTIPYFHWTVMLEEEYLSAKHGESYRAFLKHTARYFGRPQEGGSA